MKSIHSIHIVHMVLYSRFGGSEVQPNQKGLGYLDTEAYMPICRLPCDDGARDGHGASPRPAVPKIASKPRKSQKAGLE